jgi:hypothetical protein
VPRSFVPYNAELKGLPKPPTPRAGASVPVRNQQGPSFRPPGSRVPPASPGVLLPTVVGPAGVVIGLLGFYVALHTGYAGEILKVFLHVPFPVVVIFAVLVPLVVAIAGRVTNFFQTPLAIPWLLLNGWMCLCAVFSFYPRESVSELVPYVLRLQIMPLLFCAVATTSKSMRTLVGATAIGVLSVLVLCATKGEMQEGTRFGIADTSMENPNDLAFHLLWGSTLLLLFLLHKGKLGKIVATVAIMSSFWFILKTASRANFITIFAVVAVAFLLAAPSVRFVLALVVPVGLAIALPLLPRATLDRILAIEVTSDIDQVGKESSEATDVQLQGALGSEAARMELMKLAVQSTFRHPVFGVGMAMFANETADFIMATTGRKAPWQTAHNSYLKISSEDGIPGLIFYAWSIFASIAMTWKTFMKSRGRPGFEDTSRNSVCILLALVVYAVGTFFCDIVYLPYLSITVGLAAANFLAFRNEDGLAAALARFSPPSGVR